MTQFKAVKKKEKTKKNEKTESRPVTPVDKKAQAENNLREMIREAHRIHKDHIARSRNGSLKSIAKESPKKLMENRNSSVAALDEHKKQKTKRSNRADDVKVTSAKAPPGKIRRRNQEKETAAEMISEEFDKSKKKVSKRIELQRKRPASSDVPKHPTKKDTNDDLITDTNIKYYQLGPTSRPFVSLNVLDKMKCRESDTCLRQKRGILRQKKKSGARDSSLQKKTEARDEGNRKTDEKKSNDAQAKEKKHGTRKASARKSDSQPAKPESVPKETDKATVRQSKSKPAESRPKNDSLNLNSATAGIDPCSSNASRFYFSSEPDVSKIDKKFMQIIQAVTQYNPIIDIASRPVEEPDSERNNSAPSQEEKEGNEIQEQLLRRIKSLERALQIKTPSSRESEKHGLTAEESKVKPSEIQELYVKENSCPKEVPTVGDGKEEHNLRFDPKKEESLHPEEIGEPRQEEVKPEEREETNIQKPEETRDQTKEKPAVGADTKERPSTSEDHKQKAEQPKQVREAEAKLENKSVEAWSIIKRLEKAFETLGFNLDELESSDEEGKLSAKKKPRSKKQESYGKEKKVSAKSETLNKMEQSTASTKKKTIKRHPVGIQFGVESNGSGDKSMEYKPVRSSQKSEDLKRVVKRVKDRTDKNVYYAMMKTDLPPESVFDFKTMNPRLSKKRYSIEEALEDGANPKKSRMAIKKIFFDGLDIDLGERKHFKNGGRERNVHDDDLCRARRSLKRKLSDNSLSLSRSFTSLSEEDNLNYKRKRSFLKLPETNTSEDELSKIKFTGTGDAVAQIHPVSRHRAFDGEARKALVVRAEDPSLKSTKERFKMEEENNELDLKSIRERHKQIISEIKTSLDEIKKQHNLFTKLRVQTKRFNRDCHAKRKMIAAYLRDVERTYESRRERRSSRSRYGRALSSESYYYKIHEDRRARDKLSDYDLQMTKLRKRMREYLPRNRSLESICSLVPARDESSTEDISSVFLNHTSTDFRTTEEEAYRSYGRERRRRKRTGMLYLGWKKTKEESPERDRVPGYLLQLMDKLNRVIITEKNQLEELVVKASGSSNSSSHSDKSKMTDSGKHSRSWFNHPVKNRKKVEDSNRVNSEGYRTSSSESVGFGTHKHHKPKRDGGKRSGFEDVDDDISQSKPRSFIQGDPGGCSADSLPDRERELLLPESQPNPNKKDPDSPCIASCKNLEKRAEEVRYRKGDPSFRTRGHWLKTFGEHSRHCRRRTPEEERAQRRRTELERILEFEDRAMKRPFARNFDGHTLDYESSHWKGKHFGHGKHRQKSIIIDHNRSEENEESQTVLGHASRHNSFARSRRAPHEYLRGEKRSEMYCYTARNKQDPWKRHGRRQHAEETPVNYLDLTVDNPCFSGAVSKDVDCQTDNIEDYDDVGDIYLWDDSGSNNSHK